MNALLTRCRLFTASVAMMLSGCAGTASQPVAVDWQNAMAAFAIGEQQSPMVFTMKDAARCRGRWLFHADALKGGAFPDAAMGVFIEELRFTSAMGGADFFLIEDGDHPANRNATKDADRLMALALAGDGAAARTYFENLGQCYARPEEVRDVPELATDAAATITRQSEALSIEPVSSDFDEPVNQQRLAFIELFVQRLRAGAPVADLLKPQISYVYAVKHDCAAATTGYIDLLPASDVDTGFPFVATYTWESPDCVVPPELDSIEAFNLKATMSQWNRIEAAAEDHNFDVFVLADRARNDYLLISIEPYRKGYAVSKIEYRLERL
ncbi:hypothetical protein [Parasphingorhabdus sp.]|uniref:hypothetical protein n=1 Tax=Parasphingorhabdus sp. TaxID=2709688 RepID=UPI003BAF241E